MVRIRREAYPTRLPFLQLFAQFRDLVRCAMRGEFKARLEAAGVLPMSAAVARRPKRSFVSDAQARAACEELLGQFLTGGGAAEGAAAGGEGASALASASSSEGNGGGASRDEEEGVANKAFQVGRTKVFLRHHVMGLLRRRQDAFFGASAAVLQAAARRFLGKRRFERSLRALVRLQTWARIASAARGLRLAKAMAARIQVGIYCGVGS